jgi:hypothetical protein
VPAAVEASTAVKSSTSVESSASTEAAPAAAEAAPAARPESVTSKSPPAAEPAAAEPSAPTKAKSPPIKAAPEAASPKSAKSAKPEPWPDEHPAHKIFRPVIPIRRAVIGSVPVVAVVTHISLIRVHRPDSTAHKNLCLRISRDRKKQNSQQG